MNLIKKYLHLKESCTLPMEIPILFVNRHFDEVKENKMLNKTVTITRILFFQHNVLCETK